MDKSFTKGQNIMDLSSSLLEESTMTNTEHTDWQREAQEEAGGDRGQWQEMGKHEALDDLEAMGG